MVAQRNGVPRKSSSVIRVERERRRSHQVEIVEIPECRFDDSPVAEEDVRLVHFFIRPACPGGLGARLVRPSEPSSPLPAVLLNERRGASFTDAPSRRVHLRRASDCRDTSPCFHPSGNVRASAAPLHVRTERRRLQALGPPSRCENLLGGSECRLFDLNSFSHDSFDPFVDPTLTMESGQKRGPSGQLSGNRQGRGFRPPDHYGFLPS